MAFLVRGASMENHFVKRTVSYVPQFLKRCEPPLMIIYGEFGTVVMPSGAFSINRGFVASVP